MISPCAIARTTNLSFDSCYRGLIQRQLAQFFPAFAFNCGTEGDDYAHSGHPGHAIYRVDAFARGLDLLSRRIGAGPASIATRCDWGRLGRDERRLRGPKYSLQYGQRRFCGKKRQSPAIVQFGGRSGPKCKGRDSESRIAVRQEESASCGDRSSMPSGDLYRGTRFPRQRRSIGGRGGATG